MRFEHANLLWLLLVVPPALALFFWWSMRVRQKLLAQFIQARLLSNLVVGISPTRLRIRFALIILAVALLIFALARPQYGYDLQEVEQRGLDIVVAVDTSQSMLATDIAPNRLTRAKLAAMELMQRAATDRLGLIAFAGDAFLECPLTIDNNAFQQSVQALDTKTIPEVGTSLSSCIDTALKAFKEKDHYKALVIFTDGEDNDTESGALESAQRAAKEDLKIFTIGIGSTEGTLIQAPDASGASDYVRDDQGNVHQSKLNESLLRQIATITGGFYEPLRGASVIDTLYNQGLAPLPKSEGNGKSVQRYHEQYKWPLAGAIALLLLELLLPERKRELNPVKAAGLPAAAKVAAALLAGAFLPQGLFASPASALSAYNSGNYTNALEEYEKLAAIQTNDLRLVFNAGAAAYRATNYDKAFANFNLVTLSPDIKLQEQAYYNLGNTSYRMGELKFEPNTEGLEAMTAAWQEALKYFTNAIDLDKTDSDATNNLAFVKHQIVLVEQLREAIRRAKLAADDAVRRDEYHRALEIMENLGKNKIAAKKFEDYTKKLKDIDAIATPSPDQH
jgi:Ca-activated chloride channel family protein